MKDINTPLKIDAKLLLKNRVVVPPMASQTADTNGFVTKKTIEHYRRLSSSRASLVMVEYTYVNLSGRSETNQLGISRDEHVSGLSSLVNAIHSQGSISAIQLTHAGAKGQRTLSEGKLLSPSGIKAPVKGTELEKPNAATINQIIDIRESFIDAAVRATNAGFKIVELHSAHGYGLNQWLSPITNKRNDQYGGSLENQTRLLTEIIEGIKYKVPSINLSVRIPGMDHFEEGLTITDSIYLSKKLERLGVKIINVSSGLGGWRRPYTRNGEGYLVDDASKISKKVNIPVIGVGGIKTAKYINESLQDNRFSLAAVGRAILDDPIWGIKAGLS
jgi:NADPH2 dehydrogenase